MIVIKSPIKEAKKKRKKYITATIENKNNTNDSNDNTSSINKKHAQTQLCFFAVVSTDSNPF